MADDNIHAVKSHKMALHKGQAWLLYWLRLHPYSYKPRGSALTQKLKILGIAVVLTKNFLRSNEEAIFDYFVPLPPHLHPSLNYLHFPVTARPQFKFINSLDARTHIELTPNPHFDAGIAPIRCGFIESCGLTETYSTIRFFVLSVPSFRVKKACEITMGT